MFTAPDDPDRTVLIMDANPFTNGNGFHPDAVYRFNIDTNGDALADVAFSFTFSDLKRRPPDRHRLPRHRQPGPDPRTSRRHS